MTLRKIAEPPKLCTSPDHHVPTHLVLEPGTWEHVCSGCGRVTVITIPQHGFCYPLTEPLAEIPR